MTTIWPQGLLTALVTPLENDELNVPVLAELIEQQIASGVKGLVIGGGTGEYSLLTTEERLRLGREAIRLIDGRVAAVVHTGALTTRDAITLSQDAAAAGATGLLIASPYGEAISWAERLRFYERVTASVSVPVMIYNTPPSGLLTLDEVRQLAELPNVSAVKDSSGDPVLMGDLLTWSADTDFAVYVGLDSYLYDAIGAGATGAVFGAPNIVPDLLAQIADAVIADGQSEALRARWQPLREFLRFMEVSPNYMALCKAGCALNGIAVGDVREPYLMPHQDEVDELRSRLADVRAAFAVVAH